MSVESLYVNACVAKLEQLASRITACLSKLGEEQIWERGHENENAVGNMVLHLMGNVRQRVMHALGGQPDVRMRDEEFATGSGLTAEQLEQNLRETMQEAVQIISKVTPEQMMRTYAVQNTTPSGVEILLNVVEHFSHHTGQIIYVTKHVTGEDLAFFAPRRKAGV